MDDNSWLMLPDQDPACRLPQELAERDLFGARDCGWVEQMRPFIRQFCPPAGLVIDPFCGFGSTLLAAHLEGRRGIGIELEPSRAEIATERMRRADAGGQTVLTGDTLQVASSLPQADLILTNIPYFGCRWPEDGGPSQLYKASTYARFLEKLYLVFKALKPVLREGGFLVVMAENLHIGQHFVPMAWDVARVLSERYDLVDERILLYERLRRPVDAMAVQSNRAHEYALVAMNHPKPIDVHDAWNCLQELVADFPDFIVYGSYARWLQWGDLERMPSDVDLLVPNDLARLAALVRWLEARGFQISRWGVPASSQSVPIAAGAAHYFRAHRLRASGELCIIDVCFDDAQLAYASASKQAWSMEGIRVLPVGRDVFQKAI